MAFRTAALFAAFAFSPGFFSAAEASETFFEFEDAGFLASKNGEYVHAALQAALRGETGPPDPTKRLSEVENTLRPIYDALEHNQFDRLDTNALRYLMYRHFTSMRGWLMHGLAAQNASFTTSSLHLPLRVRDDVQRLLDTKGATLREAAVIATLLEQQVFDDGVKRLRAMWKAYGLDLQDKTDAGTFEKIMDAHVLTYLYPRLWEDSGLGDRVDFSTIEEGLEWAEREYPGWAETKGHIFETLKYDLFDPVPRAGGIGLSDATFVVQDVVEQFGRWQDKECHTLKTQLLKMETNRAGRVDLLAFYEAADQGFILEERIDYLRSLGALDESQPDHPAIMVPNYMMSATNYIGESGDFDLACTDECDDLMKHIELQVGAPTANVGQLAHIVQSLPSPSASANPEVLTGELFSKLAEIAQDGKVHLHGRLFALWLHHVFPRDCPYPHPTGTAEPQLTQDSYELRTGRSALMLRDERLEVMDELRQVSDEACTELPWDNEEEFVYAKVPASPGSDAGSFVGLVRLFLFAASGVAAASALLRAGCKMVGDVTSTLHKVAKTAVLGKAYSEPAR